MRAAVVGLIVFFTVSFSGCDLQTPGAAEFYDDVPGTEEKDSKNGVIRPLDDFGDRKNFAMSEFDGRLIITGGWDGEIRYNDVRVLDRDLNWSEIIGEAGFSARTGHSMFVFNGALWVVGGYDGELKNDIWFSGDGKKWVKGSEGADFSARLGHSTIVYNGIIWLIGGSGLYSREGGGDIWWSMNGVDWIKAADLPFEAGAGHKSVVYKGKMWVVGAQPAGAVYKNYVYNSENGRDWNRIADNAGLGIGSIESLFVYEDKLWAAGNMCPGSGKSMNKLFSTSDGAKWTESNIPASAIACGGVLVNYPDAIVSVGGEQ